MKIIDISIPLNNDTAIYPDNVALTITVHHAMPEYATALSAINMGSHTGTHIDAPAHVVGGGANIDKIPLEHFVGPCRVFDFSKEMEESVTKAHLEPKNIQPGERILLKTKNSLRGFKEFYENHVYLNGDAADYARRGTRRDRLTFYKKAKWPGPPSACVAPKEKYSNTRRN